MLLFQSVLEAHQAGRLEEAEQGYLTILRAEPRHADALHLLGLIRSERGSLDEAESLIRQAVDIRENAVFLCNLGNVLADQGKSQDAEAMFHRAAEISPSYAFAHHNIGTIFMDAQRYDEAERAFKRAIEYDPSLVEAFVSLGVIQMESGRLSESESSIRSALALDPGRPRAHFLLGLLLTEQGRLHEAEMTFRESLAVDPDYIEAHNRLGILLMNAGRFPEAEAAFRRAICIAPEHSEAYNNLGTLLLQDGRPEEGEAELNHALRLAPNYAQAHYNLGTRMMHSRRFLPAEASLRRAIEIAPAYSDAWLNLGNTLTLDDRHAQAESVYRKAIEVAPEPSAARWSLALLLLANGRYAEGWRYAESRYDSAAQSRITLLPLVDYPQWRGESLHDKSLVILHEQGLGDSIQFVRYAPLLKARGLRRLTVVCPAVLKPLMETADGVDEVVTELTQTPAHDFWVLTMSLPLHFNTTVETIPSRLPYLYALPQRIVWWREYLPRHGLKVGLIWKGNAAHGRDATRSLPGLETLAPLWSVEGVSFISLQKGQGESEAERAAASLRLTHLGGAVNDFADSAAIVAQLDLVISVDTSVAHLAGALGKTCWIMLPMFSTDWRWLRERTDSPWYPGVMRLFRQTRLDDWDEVVARMVVALEEWVKTFDEARNQLAG